MFGLGQKRHRSSRTVSLRVQSSLWTRLGEALRDRNVLLRIGLCLLGILGLLVAVQSWKAPFPYREGDTPEHGIAAKVGFSIVDAERTQQLRTIAEQEAPYVFVNHPELLDTLPLQLRVMLGSIAQATSIEEVPLDVRQAFGLSEVEPGKDSEALTRYRNEPPEERFQALKSSVSMDDSVSANRKIEDLIGDFEKFLTPLRILGRIDLRDVREQKIPANGLIRVITQQEGKRLTNDVLLPQVRLSDRLNETGDLGKSWLSYPGIPQPIQSALCHWLLYTTPPTLLFDGDATREIKAAARETVPDVVNFYNRGDQLVEPGEMIDQAKLELLKAEYAAAEQKIGLGARLMRVAVVFVMLLVLAGLTSYYIIAYEPTLTKSFGRLSVYLMVIVAAAALGRSLSHWSQAEVIPIVATVMVFAIAYDQVLATLTGFTLALILTLSTTSRFDQFVVLMSTVATAAIPLNRVASRSALIKVGFYAGISYFLTTIGVGIIQSQTLDEVFSNSVLLKHASLGAGWCLAAGYLVAGSLPFVEKAFGVVTDISLLELSDPSHPLLQELVRRAPGTYNHSISVASIAEAAAEAIGANGLLVRVGAYFHDIGKMLKPQYFIENIASGSENKHQHLAPAMSTLIIIGHVKDGVDLAQQHGLPQPIIDFIEQHHGTTLVEFFYNVAAREAENHPDHGHDAEESAFRYPGPKPQTRETGVLMLADCVESASRTLTDPTPSRIESLVHDLTMKRLLDGQFDECSLKLSEIRTIEKTLVKSLIAIYHSRIRYPDQKSEARTA